MAAECPRRLKISLALKFTNRTFFNVVLLCNFLSLCSGWERFQVKRCASARRHARKRVRKRVPLFYFAARFAPLQLAQYYYSSASVLHRVAISATTQRNISKGLFAIKLQHNTLNRMQLLFHFLNFNSYVWLRKALQFLAR